MKGTIGLYATYGEQAQLHKLVLYFRHDKDWTRKQRVRNGNAGKPLCVCPMTDIAEQICAVGRKVGKASCLAYGYGIAKDIDCFRQDLVDLKLNPSDFNLFCEKALPYLS